MQPWRWPRPCGQSFGGDREFKNRSTSPKGRVTRLDVVTEQDKQVLQACADAFVTDEEVCAQAVQDKRRRCRALAE